MNYRYTDNLDDFRNYKPTDSCYLDGRYFNLVFQRYPGLLMNPLDIKIKRRVSHITDEEEDSISISMHETHVNTKFPGLLKLRIFANNTIHSNLLILDYERGKVHKFEPLGKKSPYFKEINEYVERYLSSFFDLELQVIDIDLHAILDDKNERCIQEGEETGFCAAYIILYAYCFLNNKTFEPWDIRKFAAKVEDTYGKLEGEPEPEYARFGGHGEFGHGGGYGHYGGYGRTGYYGGYPVYGPGFYGGYGYGYPYGYGADALLGGLILGSALGAANAGY